MLLIDVRKTKIKLWRFQEVIDKNLEDIEPLLSRTFKQIKRVLVYFDAQSSISGSKTFTFYKTFLSYQHREYRI